MQETQDRSLGQEDPLESERATHSSILAWGLPLMGGLQSMGSKESDTTRLAHCESNHSKQLQLQSLDSDAFISERSQ